MRKLISVIAFTMLPLAGCGGEQASAGTDEAAEADLGDEGEEADTADEAKTAETDADAKEETTAASPTEKKSESTPALTSMDGFPARKARCKVSSPGGDYNGPCLFIKHGDTGGSFTVEREGGGAFLDDLVQIIFEQDTPTVGMITARQYGERITIGPAERSSEDKACWTTDDFELCAYGA